MENFAKVSTSRLYTINLQHFLKDEKIKPNKNPLRNYYNIGLTRKEFGKETKETAGEKPQHYLYSIRKVFRFERQKVV